MDDVAKFLCETLEEAMDKQDDILWYLRDWDENKLKLWVVAGFALRPYIRNDREVLARVLRCACDADACGGEEDFINTCVHFNDPPGTECYLNHDFIREVVKAAPEMLIKSPILFGEKFFAHGEISSPHCPCWGTFLDEFGRLPRDGQQVIINYFIYMQSEFGSDEDDEEPDFFTNRLNECYRVSGLTGGDDQYFQENCKG